MQAEKGFTLRCNLSGSSKHALGNVSALSFMWNLFMQSDEREPGNRARYGWAKWHIVYYSLAWRGSALQPFHLVAWADQLKVMSGGIVFTVQSFRNQNAGLLDHEVMKRGYILCKDVPLSNAMHGSGVQCDTSSSDLCLFALCYKCLRFCIQSHVVSKWAVTDHIFSSSCQTCQTDANVGWKWCLP